MEKKKKKGSHRRKRQTVGREREKGKSSRRGNRFQERDGARERNDGDEWRATAWGGGVEEK